MSRLFIATAPLLAILLLIFGVLVILGPTTPATQSAFASTCIPALPNAVNSTNLTSEQLRSARAIISAGKAAQVPVRGWVVALATALQESGLRPLPYGHLDSIGLFQQRTPWGTSTVRMNPMTSATMFYTGGRGGQPGLLDLPGWQAMPVTQAAQAVQRSAFLDAYAKWEPLARQIVTKVSGANPICATAGTWIAPIEEDVYVLTATFGACARYWTNCHTGLDFAAPQGTPTMAASDGTVIFSGYDGPYGNAVRVQHPNGIATWYAHLETTLVSAGDAVHAGDVVGLVGETGNTTGPHLHLEVRANGAAVDPHAWLRQENALP